MKLKEKMAKDYAKNLPLLYQDGARFKIARDWLAGFEAAKSMAYFIAEEYSSREGTKGPSIEVAESISRMGEKEIE